MASMISKDSACPGSSVIFNGVLLLGATGRLGGMLRRHWPEPQALRSQSREPRPGFYDFKLPNAEESPSDAALAAARGARAIISLAGVTPAHAGACDAALEDNATLALAALKLAETAGVPRLLVASSAAVYGAEGGPLQEDLSCAPLSDYGRQKLAMEKAVQEASGETAVTALRIGNVAGADAILGGWRPGMQIDRFPDGRTPSRSYIGPVTLARVLHALCHVEHLPPILNIAAPGAVEMGALLDAAGLAWEPKPAPASAIPEVRLDTKALERHVDFTPETQTPAGLVREWQQDMNKR
ncbi:NAD-dependent epimerase/dehydratase family protein [Sulfitobacter sp. S46]|nr:MULTISPECIES: NAD-dependent epimerase/dehydratase family protein [unclassified Sulfitobacter]MDH4539970.1 NAD-dependent epimerase [Sulfitobacter faviae]TKA86456.1 NAD-dependent epimerase/dehydratase family protein [Sulfitobacter sp. 15WGC]MBO9438614.1 NAD-dependent epimerase/dehydratase family protein [Sulfitobacter sp. R18_2]MDF3417619.1 NAD-dependent epimerase/dehydratase family protein [Sulfitobacter sp. Ks38]MDF3428682.1 NAD-dependent epimerase/dehydratase family protein [Sulfitobacter 